MYRITLFALRSLKARPLRTLLTTFGIVLGVAVILAISITNLSTLESITTLFNEASGKAHLVVMNARSGQGFSGDILRRVATTADVKAAVPVLEAQALLVDEAPPIQMGLSFFGAVGSGLLIYGIDPSLDPEAREYKIVDGKFLPADLDTYDIVLVKDYADTKKVKVGNDLEILTPTGAQKLRIVGLMSKEGPGQLNNGAFGAMPLQTAQQIFERGGELDHIDIVAAPQSTGRAELDNLKSSLQTRLGNKYAVVYPATQGKRVTQMLGTYQLGLAFFSVIALFVGAFLIYNAFSMTVVERTREIGMLRAVGMTQSQVMGQILTEAALIGILGSALGVGAGVLLSQGLIRGMELLVGQEVRQIHVPLDGLALSLVVGICVTLAAATIPAWQAGRISPLEALRVRGNPREGWLIRRSMPLGAIFLGLSLLLIFYRPFPTEIQYPVSRAAVFGLFMGATLLIPATVSVWSNIAGPGVRRIYGNEGELGSRNTQRSKLRTTLTVAALMVGVSMILGIRGMTSAFEHDIRSWIDVYVGGDLYVHSSVSMRTDLGRWLESVDGVAAVTPVRYFDVNQVQPDGRKEDLMFTAVDPTSHRRVTSFVFASGQGDPDRLLDRLAQGDAVFISSVLSEKYGLKKGDLIRLETKRGERDFEIAAVVTDFYNQGLILEGSWNDMRRYFGFNNVTAFLVKLQPGYTQDEVRKRMDDLYGKDYHLTIESNQALKGRALKVAAQAFSMFDVLALIAIIVAALGVVNTLTMNVLERTREIGMLRSLGMTRRQVGKMILAEAGMMGLIGGVFGLLFGLFLSRLFLIAVATMQGYDLTYVLPTQGIIASVLIALVVSQVAAIWPARRAARIRMVEAVQFE